MFSLTKNCLDYEFAFSFFKLFKNYKNSKFKIKINLKFFIILMHKNNVTGANKVYILLDEEELLFNI